MEQRQALWPARNCGDQQAPDDRRRQVVASEERDDAADAMAEEEGQAAEGECLNEIELQQGASIPGWLAAYVLHLSYDARRRLDARIWSG
jgi:hypothetical protein